MDALAVKLSAENGKFFPFKCDITVEEELLNAFQWISKNVGVVNILINNAGVYRDTNLIDGDSNEWKKVLMTNVFALSLATREAVKIMRDADIQGHIINVNCLSGHRNLYYSNMNLYGASKQAVTGLTETFRQELVLAKTEIKITVCFFLSFFIILIQFLFHSHLKSISPGMVASELLLTNNIEMTKEFTDVINASPMLNPADVADAIIYIVSTPPNVQVMTLIS